MCSDSVLHPLLRRPGVVLTGLLLGAVLFALDARAQITPPAPGVDLPEGYRERIAQDRTAFQFKRAWIAETRRVQHNRRLRDLGLLGQIEGIEGLNAASGMRVEGTRRVPVLAGKFANTPSDPYSPTQLQNQLFDGPNPTGTVTDYYDEVSYGYINLTGNVYGAQAGGLFQVANIDTYYEGPTGCNGACGDANTGEYLKELLDGADPWVDFAQFDNDGPDGIANSGDDDGYVDFVAFVHPEKGGECGGNDNIWSHRWVYEGWWGDAYMTSDASASGGFVKVSDYTIQPLLACDGTSLNAIGVYAHEFGHAFGLPDLYDTDTLNGTSAGVGQWCLMGSGSWGGDGAHPATPSHMCAWSKEALGWVEPHVVCGTELGFPLPAVEDSASVLKLYPHGTVDSEYFLLENRVKTKYDTYLPTSGIAVWHIDNTISGNADENHKLVDLEEADGLAEMDADTNRGNAGDLYPGSTNNQLFNDVTNPNAKDYAGVSTGVVVGPFGATIDPRSLDVSATVCRLAVGDVAVNDLPWGNNNGTLDGDERANLRIGLRNDFDSDATGVVGTLTSLTSGVVVLQNSVSFGTVTLGVLNYGLSEFEIEATGPLANGAPVQFQLDLLADGGYATSHVVALNAGTYVLLVEDDGAAAVNTAYQNAITAAGYAWVRHDTGTAGVPTLGQLESAVAVVWYTGDEYDATFTPDEQSLIQSFLSGGGSLFVTGQDIGYDLVSEGSAADVSFYQNYLHATFVSDTSGDNTLTGVTGDPIGNGLSVTLTNLPSASFWPSVVTARSGASDVIRYSVSQTGGIRYGTGHKAVYFAFNFEDINSTTTQNTAMLRVLTWLQPADITPPTIALTAPIGGESFEACAPANITWTAGDNVAVTGVDLYYSDDGGATYPHVIASGLANSGTFVWYPGGLLGTDFRVKAVARDAMALQAVESSGSSFVFVSTAAPLAQVVSPNGGEGYALNASVPVVWSMGDTCVGVDSTQVRVSLDGGGSWSYVVTVPAPDTTAVWTAPGTPQDSCLVRVDVFSHGGATADDVSDAFFAVGDVTVPTVTVTAPNGGETFVGLANVQIDATVGDDVGVDSVCVAYTLDDGATWVSVACGALSFPYSWIAPDVVSDSCRVRVQVWDAVLNTAVDSSDSLFSIASITAVPPGLAGIRRPVLLQNFPNPMRASSTQFAFYLPEEMSVSLRIYDLSGRAVRTVMAGSAAAGYHELSWNGADDGGRQVGHGIYFYVLETPGKREARKLVKVN